ncbi:MAG: tetratricopeptide repeat protein [Trueperaceae bacterium]|nr:tetratricopeptide repeat protein [Trueperaceae bacterium]
MQMDIVRRGAFGLLVMIIATLGASAMAQASVAESRAAVQERPTDPDAWTRLGNALYEAGEAEDAKDAYLEAIAVDYLAGDAHFGLGLVEFGRGDFQAALFAFNEVTRLFPDRFDGHFNRAVTLARLRRPADAAAAFERALEEGAASASGQDRLNAYIGLAGQLVAIAAFDRAADAYGEALVLSPDDADLPFNRGAALVNAGRGLEALAELTDIEARTSDYRFSALIAEVYVEAGQIDYALRALDRATRKARDAGDVAGEANSLVALGELQRGLGRDGDATQSFSRAAQVDPTSWEARYNLGVGFVTGGQPRSALGPLQEAASINPESPDVQLALASAYDQIGMSAEALAAGRIVIERTNDREAQAQARFIVGRALFAQGDYNAASQEFMRVVEARPGSSSAQLWAGLAEYQKGDYAGAALFYERAVQLDPNAIEARVNLGAAYLASERFRDAEGVYRLLVQQNSRDAESHYNLGWSLYAQQRDADARTAWSSSCQLGYQAACSAPRR